MEYDYLDRKTMKAVKVTYNCEHCGKKLHMNEDCKCPEALTDQEEKNKWPSHVIGGTDEEDGSNMESTTIVGEVGVVRVTTEVTRVPDGSRIQIDSLSNSETQGEAGCRQDP